MAKTYALQFGAGDPRSFGSLSPTFLAFVNMTNGATLVPPAISESLPGLGLYQFTYGVTQPITFLADAATTSPGAAARYVTGQIDPADRIDEIGTTLVAIGTSNIALGTTNIAIGISNIALGTTNVAIGTTLLGFGASNFALGTTNFALGTTNVALGISNFALGTSIFAGLGTSTTILSVGSTLTAIGSLLGLATDSYGTTGIDPVTVFGFLRRAQELAEGDEIYTKATGLLDFYSRGQTALLREKTITDTSSTTSKT